MKIFYVYIEGTEVRKLPWSEENRTSGYRNYVRSSKNPRPGLSREIGIKVKRTKRSNVDVIRKSKEVYNKREDETSGKSDPIKGPRSV